MILFLVSSAIKQSEKHTPYQLVPPGERDQGSLQHHVERDFLKSWIGMTYPCGFWELIPGPLQEH